MSKFFVPRSDPRAIDDMIVEAYPALGLRTTSNSGAYWGDGDLRSEATEYDTLQFAAETKVRFNNRKSPFFSPTEIKKASSQLLVRSPQAIRLFIVWNLRLYNEHSDRAFTVAMRHTDRVKLREMGLDAQQTGLRKIGHDMFSYFAEPEFDDLYYQIEEHHSIG